MMSRRRLALAGLVLVSPLLLFTLWAAFLGIHALLVESSSRDRWVENRLAEPIWISPVMRSDRDIRRVPHYPSGWPDFSPQRFEEILIPAGETRLLVVDGYVEADMGGPTLLVVRTAGGDHFSREMGDDGREVIADLSSWKPAGPDMIAAVSRRQYPEANFGIPEWVIVALGVLAPVVVGLLCLAHRRCDRSRRR